MIQAYPTELLAKVTPVAETIDQSELNKKGLFVMQGLDIQIAKQLIKVSLQGEIVKNCEADSTRRFVSIDSIVNWHLKGRLPLPLVRRLGNDTLELAGFGWMGPENLTDNEPKISGAKTTFATRIYNGFTGQRNSLPYTRAILDVHRELYGNEGIWLSAWGDNSPALATYEKAGFETVDTMPGLRHGQEVSRVYMALRQPETEVRR
jgi:hypothetical protein